MDSPFAAALVRSVWSAFATFIAAAGGSYIATNGLPLTDEERLKVAVVAGVVAVFGPIAARGVGEGAYDQHRAATGEVSTSDVAMASPKLTVIDNATQEPVPDQKLP